MVRGAIPIPSARREQAVAVSKIPSRPLPAYIRFPRRSGPALPRVWFLRPANRRENSGLTGRRPRITSLRRGFFGWLASSPDITPVLMPRGRSSTLSNATSTSMARISTPSWAHPIAMAACYYRMPMSLRSLTAFRSERWSTFARAYLSFLSAAVCQARIMSRATGPAVLPPQVLVSSCPSTSTQKATTGLSAGA